MGVIIFNGRASNDYGIVVEAPPDHPYPERDYEVVHVPGRNGDLTFDNGSYKNVSIQYQIALGSRQVEFYELVDALFAWLHPSVGYARLEDSYEPEHYRMAYYQEGNTLTNIEFHAGRATLTFEAKPQRFLKIGEKVQSFTAAGTLLNPTQFDALPLIKVYINSGETGNISVNGYKVAIASDTAGSGRYIIIDCDLQDAYAGTTNRNSLITLSSGNFPRLSPGKNQISFSGGITKVEVTPRWWTL